MDKVTHQVRRERWTAIINECLASGMNKTAWCRANGISDKSFFYWQKTLRQEAYIKNEVAVIPGSTVPATKPGVNFVELRTSKPTLDHGSEFHPDIVIRKGNIALEISNSASAELLSLIGGILHAQ